MPKPNPKTIAQSSSKLSLKAQNKATSSANKQKEIGMIDLLRRLTGLPISTDKDHLTLPYRHSGRRFACDAVWFAPSGSPYKGIAFEIQGMGQHTMITGMVRDGMKLAIAQSAGWMVFQWPHKDAQGAAKALLMMVKAVIAASYTPQDRGAIDVENAMDSW